MSLREQAVNGVFWSSVEKIGQVVVQIVISIILARLLTPDDYGVIGILSIFIIIANVFVDAGFTQGLIRKLDCTSDDYNSVFLFNFGVGVIIYAILFLSSPFIARYFENPLLEPLSKVLFLVIPINSFSLIQVTILNKELNFKLVAKYTIISSVLSGIVGILMALEGFGAWALVCQSVLVTLLYTIFLWFKSDWKPQFCFSFAPIKELLPFTSKLFVSSFLNTVFNNMYPFIIAKLYSPKQLGYYSQANKYATQPTGLLEGILNRVTYPVLALLQNDKEKFKCQYQRMQVLIFAFIVLIMSILYICSEELIYILLSEKWMPIVPYFNLMCFIGMTLPLHPLCMSVLKVYGKSGLIFKLEIVKKIVIGGLLLATYQHGIIALLYGQVAFFIFALFLNMYFSGKIVHYSMKEQLKEVFPYVLTPFVAAGGAFLLVSWIHNIYCLLLLKFLLTLIIYISLIFVFKLGYITELIQMIYPRFMNCVKKCLRK